MQNESLISPCQQWRYSLIHKINEIPEGSEPKLLVWLGLNPAVESTSKPDPTLKRIACFSKQFGYDGFVMLNLFAWRDTDPDEMMKQIDPVGRENDAVLDSWAKPGRKIVCCWGNHGGHLSRWRKVAERLKGLGAELMCLDTNKDGSPKHPLYVKGDLALRPWVIPREIIEEPWQRRKRLKAERRREGLNSYV